MSDSLGMVRGAEGNGEKTKMEKEGKCETKKSYEEEEGEGSNQGLKIDEKAEVCTLELGEAEDHFELCEGIRSN